MSVPSKGSFSTVRILVSGRFDRVWSTMWVNDVWRAFLKYLTSPILHEFGFSSPNREMDCDGEYFLFSDIYLGSATSREN